jgi:hypothetical protein
MNEKKAGMFQEDNGNSSAMRLMCVISLLASIWFAWLTIQTESEFGLYITFGFLLGAFAPKAVQKLVEVKTGMKQVG